MVTNARELLEGSRASPMATAASMYRARERTVNLCSDFIGGRPKKGLAQFRERVIARLQMLAGYGPGDARLRIVAGESENSLASDISRIVRE